MNSLLTVVCLYVCVSFSYSDKGKESRKDYFSLERQSFKSKDDIPKEYIEHLKEIFDITDPPPLEKEAVHKTTMEKEVVHRKIDSMDYEKNSEIGLDYVNSDYIEESNETDTSNETCKMCKVREQDKQLRLQSIKSEILNKLGFSNSHLPNMTGKRIPRTPSLQKLIEQYDMQGDAPYGGFEEYLPEDEYYGQVQRAYTISQPRKYSFILSEFDVKLSSFLSTPLLTTFFRKSFSERRFTQMKQICKFLS